ncbi:hypothetical protein [Microcoleus sp. B4-C5]|uniref:hypothetical protein n=1 Tax=Microcoleus sp. B4-C5 TaxID=2818664 RepID=UPI002FCF036D
MISNLVDRTQFMQRHSKSPSSCQLNVKPAVRQGIHSLPQSQSPLKRTEKKNFGTAESKYDFA